MPRLLGVCRGGRGGADPRKDFFLFFQLLCWPSLYPAAFDPSRFLESLIRNRFSTMARLMTSKFLYPTFRNDTKA